MMGIKNEIDKKQLEIMSLDQLVPEDHLVRSLEAAIDLRFFILCKRIVLTVWNGEHRPSGTNQTEHHIVHLRHSLDASLPCRKKY